MSATSSPSSLSPFINDDGTSVPDGLLVKMFTRLDLVASQLVLNRPQLLQDHEIAQSAISKIFSSLEEVNDSLSQLLNSGFKLVRTLWMIPSSPQFDAQIPRPVGIFPNRTSKPVGSIQIIPKFPL
ncbi:hypothetical protein DL98DRAFT_597738 [Cadophora sp. DSE1049]|nr:hypothetical protein DL98DRAFT_597738 [Cadophora sp. DSE1049]